MKKNINPQKTVYNFISPTKMKFRSPNKGTDSDIKPPSVLTKIKSFSWLGSPTKRDSKLSVAQSQNTPQNHTPGSPMPSPLKFIKKLTNEHFLVGNQYRVDVMYLGGIVQDFIDTEYCWSLDFKKGISDIVVDTKKCLLAFVKPKQVQIYQYNLKKSRQKPAVMVSVPTSDEVRFIQFPKDTYLVLFYDNRIEIYIIDENVKEAKKIYIKAYNQPEGASIFQVPQAYDGVLNIFFIRAKQSNGLFELWNLDIKLQKQDIKMGSFMKIYDVSGFMKDRLVISNYSKEIYCINQGYEILAVKKGYVIDKVKGNITDESTILKYTGTDRLIHVLPNKLELYKFTVNTISNPPRIVLESTDSILTPITDNSYSFLDVLEMLHDNLAVFYQISEQKNNSLSGQIKYSFCVTQKVKFQDKVKSVLPSPEELLQLKKNNENKISEKDLELIEQKVDMVMKMGLTKKQIYLKLWNNSTKCDIVDFQFLLDTMDYDTVKAQIETKLKKKSMVLREVIKIEEGCLGMLQPGAFDQHTNQQSLKNFLISHFLLRKLKLYQMFSLIERSGDKLRKSRIAGGQAEKQESQTIMINIKDYLLYSKCDLKAVLLQLIRDFCVPKKDNPSVDKKDTVLKIRTLVKLFRFSFRPIYAQLLEEIIKEAGLNLLTLLQAIPQFLPFEPFFEEEPTDPALYEGIWGDILPQQWENNLYASGITTIDNKEVVEEFNKGVWAKRFFLTNHDLLPYQKAQILMIHQRNKAEQTFYNFIEKVFFFIKDSTVLANLIKFIEDNYAKLPRHLVGTIFLHKALYDYLKKQNALKPKLQKGDLNEFLKLKDFQICKMIFDLEKRKKNCILKDVKQGIYNSPQFAEAGGNDLFNLALLNFFSSQLSQISDIKYLLNRLNNEKVEFHEQNQGMYEVIIKGMQAKLYIGSSHDIPIDEVYIYISNIHIDENSEIQKDLRYLDVINKYSEKFRKVQLNMSVFEIIREIEKVLTAVINYEVGERKIFEKTDDKDILRESLQILDEVQKIKTDIFSDAGYDRYIIIFTYLIKILEQEHFVSKVKTLLSAQEIIERYDVQELMIENAVLYMYKQRFSQDKVYRHSETYIKELITLLPEENQIRQFISYELELALCLSCNSNPLEYPLAGSNGILSTVQVESAINFLSGEEVKAINFERIFEISLKLQELSSDGQISSISLYQIYEIAILRLLECKMIRDSIPIIRKIIELNPLNSYNFVYPVLLIKKFAFELCDQNRVLLMTIMSYHFEDPEELLKLVEKLLNTKATSLEQKVVLKAHLRRVQQGKKIFLKQNPIFDKDYIEAIVSDKEELAFGLILRKVIERLMQTKQEFMRSPEYSIIFSILINDPYGVIKYLYCSRYESNFKGIRCFFSHLNKQEVFSRSILLQLGKRLFSILHEGLSETNYIETIIDNYKETPLTENMDIKKIKADSNLSIVMSKSVQRFKNKQKEEMNPNKKKNVAQESPEERKKRICEKLASQYPEIDEVLKDYLYPDSDNELAKHEAKLEKILTSEQAPVVFDPIFQQQLMISRNTNTLSLYISQEHSVKQKDIFYSRKLEVLEIKNSVAKLKNKKKELEDEYSLRLTARSCSNKFQSSFNGLTHSITINNPLKRINSIQLPDTSKSIPIKQGSDKIVILEQNEEAFKSSQIPLEPLEVCQATISNQSIMNKILSKTQGDDCDITPITQTQLDENQFKELINQIYLSENFSVSQTIGILKKLAQNSAPCSISHENLEVYSKMDNFQKKYSLEIDFKQMFPINGAFILSKGTSELFNFVKESIIRLLTENNVYKITKVVSLAFKNNEIESELNIAFLIKLIKEFQTAPKEVQAKEKIMQKEKIRGFTQKISIHQLNVKDEDILNSIQDPDLKNELIDTIAETMKKKKNEDMANKFLAKWKA